MTDYSLDQWIASGDGLARYAAHGQRLLQLQRLFEATLTKDLKPHARVANIKSGKLLIHTTGGAVAARIRQLGPSIARELSLKGAQVTQIVVRVQVRDQPRRYTETIRPDLPGVQQKQGLTKLTQSLPDDSPLKGALRHLLRTISE
jgi:hypothetical protein